MLRLISRPLLTFPAPRPLYRPRAGSSATRRGGLCARQCRSPVQHLRHLFFLLSPPIPSPRKSSWDALCSGTHPLAGDASSSLQRPLQLTIRPHGNASPGRRGACTAPPLFSAVDPKARVKLALAAFPQLFAGSLQLLPPSAGLAYPRPHACPGPSLQGHDCAGVAPRRGPALAGAGTVILLV